MTPLCELACKYGTDKGPFKISQPDLAMHNYTPEYYQRFADRRNQVRKVLEIGIGHGGSLKMWEEFFPNARIYGVDINPGHIIKTERIKCFVADQSSERQLKKLKKKIGSEFDLIIDDGYHKIYSQAITVMTLIPLIAHDGFYFLEDITGDHMEIIKHVPCEFYYDLVESERLNKSGQRFSKMLILSRRLK